MAMVRISVHLPAPLGPSNPNIMLLPMVRLRVFKGLNAIGVGLGKTRNPECHAVRPPGAKTEFSAFSAGGSNCRRGRHPPGLVEIPTTRHAAGARSQFPA